MKSILGLSPEVAWSLLGIAGVLTFFSILFFIWKIFKPHAPLKELIDRTKSWWVIYVLFVGTIFLSKTVAIIAIAFLSFVALREMLSRLDFRFSDRRAMFWAYLVIPIQFYCVYISYYRLFIVLIPVVMFMILPFRNVLTGEVKGITQSTAKLQWALMLTVFSLSHIAYLLAIKPPQGFTAGNEAYILYLLFLTQFNDVLQFIWGKLLGKHKIIPKISPNKTWEGFLGGLICTTLLAYFLRYLTPFTVTQSLIAGSLISFSGFAGDLNISAIKRDLGIKDMGTSIPGHGGIMDRLDSLSYTALVFFHLTHLWTVP
ncbi:MAG: phosphatidate cytidylyltransferase [Bdellovibrionales bacterium]|nr:phosphatidate cytidylyltransferase [Bdellovibrionales bacterium]